MSRPDQVRPMRADDLDAVLRIQALCYTAFDPESADAMDAKRRHAAASCWVAEREGRVAGYLLALPWRALDAPALDSVIDGLPDAADCLYLHDLAIDPAARGGGVGAALVERFLSHLRAGPWPRAALIAVQGSTGFWARHGFGAVTPTPALAHKLADYGPGATYMLREALPPRPAPQRHAPAMA